jgi:protein TonB
MKRILFAALVVLMVMSVAPKGIAQSKAQAVLQAVAITDEITAPRLREVASPEYTEEARKKKIEGTVTLLIVVDTKGDVVDAKVVKGLGHGLDENAMIAVKEWKYKPAEKDGAPVAVKMEVAVEFYLSM